MSPRGAASDLAHRVADLVKTTGTWDVVGERSTQFEVHLNGTSIELERGPITTEGYGLRLFVPRGAGMGIGFQASTDLSREGVRAVLADAEASSRHSEFPARSVDLPSGNGHPPDVPVLDPALWKDPAGTLRTYVDALLRPFHGRKGTVPTFGSVKATLTELSFANSAGLHASYPSTAVELELGVKAFGGPEGAPPGEFWVTQEGRRLEPERIGPSVEDWCRYAADVRRAQSPPNGDQAVILPPDVLSGILPLVVGFRFSGAARLRKVAPEVGSTIGASQLTLRDQGDHPWGALSGPYDDEGAPRGSQALVERGAVTNLVYDALYASAFSTRSSGGAARAGRGLTSNLHFIYRPGPRASTLVVDAGDGGSLEELVEATRDGILVTQFGWANPDPISGSFGGEIRIGYRIRAGKLAEPIRGGTVGGMVVAPAGSPSLLANTEAIGNRPELADHLVAAPLLVRPLSVAGSAP